MEYAAHVTTDVERELTDDELDALVDALAPVAGVPSTLGGRLSVYLTVEADDLADAPEAALGEVVEAVGAAVDRCAELVAVEVMTADEQARRLDGPAADDLVPTSRAAEVLGVRRQRVLQLADSFPDFPRPVRRGHALLWPLPGLRAFLAEWDRRPGPKRAG